MLILTFQTKKMFKELLEKKFYKKVNFIYSSRKKAF